MSHHFDDGDIPIYIFFTLLYLGLSVGAIWLVVQIVKWSL